MCYCALTAVEWSRAMRCRLRRARFADAPALALRYVEKIVVHVRARPNSLEASQTRIRRGVTKFSVELPVLRNCATLPLPCPR